MKIQITHIAITVDSTPAKKNYLVHYDAFYNGTKIKEDGIIRVKNRTSGMDAQLGFSKFMEQKKMYPQGTHLVVTKCYVETDQQKKIREFQKEWEKQLAGVINTDKNAHPFIKNLEDFFKN